MRRSALFRRDVQHVLVDQQLRLHAVQMREQHMLFRDQAFSLGAIAVANVDDEIVATLFRRGGDAAVHEVGGDCGL